MVNEDECLKKLKLGGKPQILAITELFNAYSLPFKRYFIKHRLSLEDAEDLLQETFINIVRGADNFRHDCKARIWLWTIAKNTMLMRLRKKNPDLQDIHELADVIADPQTQDTDPGPGLEDCVEDAFQRYAQDHTARAEALTLATIHGWSTSELATFLERSIGASREYISQCRKLFKPYLEPCRDWLG